MAEPLPRRPKAIDLSPSERLSGELAPSERMRAVHGSFSPPFSTALVPSTSRSSAPKAKCTPSSNALFMRSSCSSPMPMWQKSLSPPNVPPGGSKTFAPQASRSCLHHSQRCNLLMRPNASSAPRFSTTVTSARRSASSSAARKPQGPEPHTTAFVLSSGTALYSGRVARSSSKLQTERARQGSAEPPSRWMRRYGCSPGVSERPPLHFCSNMSYAW
mmetsp:Transcript_23803/g.60605  ORF Transcript_23803/g.60605 Transcript_23803/m.60605 type:complete len:217 (-) Transcript_23803:196-846(-)